MSNRCEAFLVLWTAQRLPITYAIMTNSLSALNKWSVVASMIAGATLLVSLAPAQADAANMIIKQPGNHYPTKWEIEPQIAFAPYYGTGTIGPGIRVTPIIVDNGFIGKINNTVGITFGGNFMFNLGNGGSWIIAPVALQWNFFLTKEWSVMGEVGAAISGDLDAGNWLPYPAAFVGGRWHFTEDMALTMRAGYPSFSVGLSIML